MIEPSITRARIAAHWSFTVYAKRSCFIYVNELEFKVLNGSWEGQRTVCFWLSVLILVFMVPFLRHCLVYFSCLKFVGLFITKSLCWVLACTYYSITRMFIYSYLHWIFPFSLQSISLFQNISDKKKKKTLDKMSLLEDAKNSFEFLDFLFQ